MSRPSLVRIASALLVLSLASVPLASAGTNEAPFPTAAALCHHTAIAEEGFVPIGGIEQWVTIHGAHCDSPVVLFIHGGPGNPLSPFAAKVYGSWESRFTLVQWDQRGAGKTFGHNPGSAQASLSIEQMSQDGIALAQYLTAHLGQKKIILMGSSWGSVLAVHMAMARPDLFYAYVGSSQLVDGEQNASAAYRQALDRARRIGDTGSVTKLVALGAPPWTDPHSFGALRRITRRYEASASTAAPADWWQPAPAYTGTSVQQEEDAGEDYSYLQYVGKDGHGMFWQINLPALGGEFRIPVFLVQGAEDLNTVPPMTKHYFDTLHAPQKAYVLVPHTGHDPNVAMVDAQYRLLIQRVLPLTK
ncbi:alpha/beta hydrolase [Dyella sp. 7MK23]|uniref:Proline iminopeptidase n=2 Tax=Dyella acidiphila TaxID=2775866 RepID=A0ABR9GE69_9GAMM|nr:alpha/beta hydrolase [Dyella acidiphila]MBE1162346.1 alpha/beta hydrolase [Dyella acidiphila]